MNTPQPKVAKVEGLEEADTNVNVVGGQRCVLFFKLYWKSLVVIVVPIVFLSIFFYGNSPVFRCLYVIAVMAIYWVTEAIPVHITAFIPLFMFPLLGIMGTNDVSTQYMTSTIFMFLGGIFIAIAIEYSNLHKRLALLAVSSIGCSLRRLNLVMMLFTMFISMWIVNTGATAMMMPIAKAILDELEMAGILEVYHPNLDSIDALPLPTDVTVGVFLGLAFASTIGGIGTVIGTGTNLVLKGLFESRFPNAPPIDFLEWMMYAVPLMLISTILVWFWLQVYYLGMCRPNSEKCKRYDLPEDGQAVVHDVLKQKLREMGSMSSHEIWVAVLFTTAIILFCTRSPGVFTGWAGIVPGIKIQDASAAILIVFIMFLLPSRWSCLNFLRRGAVPSRKSTPVLFWKFVNSKTPWNLVLLIGGGFALAEGAKRSGTTLWLGEKFNVFQVLPPWAITLLMSAIAIFFTNFTSNIAVANLILPIITEMSIAINVHPFYILLPATMACSFAFGMPVGTPPNALVAGYASIKSKEMLIGGSMPTLICWLLFSLAFPLYGTLIYRETATFPEWASNGTEHLSIVLQ